MIEQESLPKEPSQALEVMMNEYGTMVLRTAYFFLGDRHLAEDASQEAFMRAYRFWPKFRYESSVKTWLSKITLNVCRDRAALKSSSEQPTDPMLLPQETQASVENEVIKRLGNTLLLKHIKALPAHYQEVLYLYYYLELSTREIAEAVRVPEGTVRGRLHRAREIVGEKLKREEWSDDE